jgi:hypothetical protein
VPTTEQKTAPGLLVTTAQKNSYVIYSLDYSMTADALFICQTSNSASFQAVTDPTALNCRPQVNLRQTFGKQEPENTSPLRSRNHQVTESVQSGGFEMNMRSRLKVWPSGVATRHRRSFDSDA